MLCNDHEPSGSSTTELLRRWLANNKQDMLQIISEQNCFQFNNQYYKQSKTKRKTSDGCTHVTNSIRNIFITFKAYQEKHNINKQKIKLRFVDNELFIFNVSKTHTD